MGARALVAALALSAALAATAPEPAPAAPGDASVVDAICGIIDSSARAQDLPVVFLTRLLWQESGFHSNAVSPVGAAGIAQFMPATAGARGLADPFDPEAAIPKAASLLAELRTQFGNLGLAAAAYNAGPGRVARFVAGQADLPAETQNYVAAITRHSVDEWRTDGAKLTDDTVFPAASCVQVVAKFRRTEPIVYARSTFSSFSAPWGVQISGSFSKAAALRQYQRAESSYAKILGGVQPMVLAGRLLSRGSRPYYRVRAPAHSRQEAEALCAKLEKVGGACVVLRSA